MPRFCPTWHHWYPQQTGFFMLWLKAVPLSKEHRLIRGQEDEQYQTFPERKAERKRGSLAGRGVTVRLQLGLGAGFRNGPGPRFRLRSG